MERIFTYTIDPATQGMTIMEFLRSKGYSSHMLTSMKHLPDSIRLNGHHEFMKYQLQIGDVLTTKLCDPQPSKNIVPSPVPFTIVYEDEDLLVIDKPANVAIHPAINHPANTLGNGVLYYYEQQGIPFVFRCINRLDRDTTGLLIVSKNALSAAVIEEALKRREIKRTYLAVVEGTTLPSGTIDLPIGRTSDSLIERCVDPEHGDRAVTHYETLSTLDTAGISSDSYPVKKCSVIKLHLETGRTHQIRVHMSHIGHPLLGDTLYNPHYLRHPEEEMPDSVSPLAMNRQALHSWKLDFIHPITGKAMHFEAEIPEDMRYFLS